MTFVIGGIFAVLAEVADNFEWYANRPLRTDIDYCESLESWCWMPACRVHS